MPATPAFGRPANLNIAATKVLNADNIQVSGSSSGTPTVVTPAAPNIGGLSSAKRGEWPPLQCGR